MDEEKVIEEEMVTLDDEEVITEESDDEIPVVDNEEVKKIVEDVKIDEEKVKKAKKELKEEDTGDLYTEFNTFLKRTVELNPDEGLKKKVVPVGIDLLDAILGGGFAIGALNIVVGQPGCGKSMLAIQAMANSQRIYTEKLITSFLDSEHATTKHRLANLGVNRPKVTPYNEITIEKVFKFLEGLCLFKEEKGLLDIPSVVIWDSIANTLSQKELETEDINSVIGYKARLLSILIPKYVSKCASHEICLIAVNQLRDVLDMGKFSSPRDLKMMSPKKNMPGGTILKYNAFHLLEMRVLNVLDPDDTQKNKYGIAGIEVGVKCVKNKLFTPNVPISIIGDFVTGFSNFWTNYKFLADTKRLKVGSWNSLVDMPDKKFRTKEAESLYKTDESFRKTWDEVVKKTIQTEIIEKYDVS